MVGAAVPLAAADLYVKARVRTEPWAYHERSLGWLLLSIILLGAMFVVTRVPSALVPPAAGVLAGGVIGNSLSAAWYGMRVPNPLVVTGNQAVLAFNLADVWTFFGIVLLLSVLGVWLVGNRHLLPDPAEIRARRAASLRRLFDGRKL